MKLIALHIQGVGKCYNVVHTRPGGGTAVPVLFPHLKLNAKSFTQPVKERTPPNPRRSSPVDGMPPT